MLYSFCIQCVKNTVWMGILGKNGGPKMQKEFPEGAKLGVVDIIHHLGQTLVLIIHGCLV